MPPTSYLPKLKTTIENRLVMPREVGVWNDDQAKARLDALAKAIDVQPGAGQIHSIPDPWARVILFGRAFYHDEHPLHQRVLGEWRGLLALIGLKDIRRFNELKVEPVVLEVKGNAASGFLSMISRLKPSEKECFADGGTWERFHVLQWCGQLCDGSHRPFALTSPATLVATGVDYSDVISHNEVPWFVQGTLVDPITPLRGQEEPSGDLSTTERHALAEWVLYVRSKLSDVADEENNRHGLLLERLQDYADELSKGTKVPKSDDFLSEHGIGLDEPALFSCLNKPRRPDSQVLTDLQIVTELPTVKIHVLYETDLSKKLKRKNQEVKEREITVFDTVTLASAARSYEGIANKRTGSLGKYGRTEVIWCTSAFFFQDDLIYEQLDADPNASLAEATTFPGCRPVKASGRIERRQIALPLTEEAARLFTPAYLAENFSINWLTDGGATCRLKLKLTSKAVGDAEKHGEQPTFDVEIEHTYREKDMNKIRNLPFVCVWPNFRFKDEPDNEALLIMDERDFRNRWKKYYLFQSWLGSSKAEELLAVPLDMSDSPKRLVEQKSGIFQITVTRRFPEVLVCQMPFTDKKPRHETRPPKALLLLHSDPESESGNQSMRSALGVDFGTTGTSVYRARVVGTGSDERTENPVPVGFGNRILQVTGRTEAEMKDLTRHYFIPARIRALGRILSVFQAHSGGRGSAEVIDGHVLFQDSDTEKPAPFVWGLEDLVRTNLKWGDEKLEADAAEAFLSQLCVQSIAELVAAGTSEVDIRYSHPTAFDATDLRRFQGVWSKVLEDLQSVTSIPIKENPANSKNYEAVAAARFFARSGDMNIMGGAMTLDIGGGTTDLAVWNQAGGKPALIAHSSVLFAGTDMFQAVLRRKLELLLEIDENFPMPKLDRERNPSAYFAEVDALISTHGDKLLKRLPRAYTESNEVRQFVSIISLGMTGIAFYSGLILGNLVRAGKYELDSLLIQVFVGGNASRLLHWCDLGQFKEDTPFYKKLSGCILEGAAMAAPQVRDGRIIEVKPSKRPKEEVAYGLLAIDLETEKASDQGNPVAGECFHVGRGESQDWSLAPDVTSLLTGELRVDSALPVFSNFLDLIGEEISPIEREKIANSINTSLMKMAQNVRQQINDPQLPREMRSGEKINPVRKQPLFIIALKRLLDMRINRLVEGE